MDSLYGFSGRLSKIFPSQVMVDITEVCNLACVHCAHPSFKISDKYNKSMLSPELNKKMVHEVAAHGENITKYIYEEERKENFFYCSLFFIRYNHFTKKTC